jgi:hypothetical protein
LNIDQHSLICSAFLVLFLVGSDEVDGQALSAEPASTAHAMQVGISLRWKIYVIIGVTVVDDEIDAFDVDASSEQVSSDKQS